MVAKALIPLIQVEGKMDQYRSIQGDIKKNNVSICRERLSRKILKYLS